MASKEDICEGIEMNNATVISNIQKWLKDNNQSQKWLATQINITPALFSQILNGKRKLQTKQLIDISNTIRVSLDDLMMSTDQQSLQTPVYQLRGSFSNKVSEKAFSQLLWDIERYVDLEESVHGE